MSYNKGRRTAPKRSQSNSVTAASQIENEENEECMKCMECKIKLGETDTYGLTTRLLR